MKDRVPLLVGGVLMALLGLARALGGLVLLIQGASADPKIRASESVATAVGLFLLILGAALVAAAIGVVRRKRWAWLAGIGLTIAFVIDGVINGYVLFGRPGDRGTLMNVIAAILILTFLVLGRSKLEGSAGKDKGGM